jgi:triosephosphate isomerase
MEQSQRPQIITGNWKMHKTIEEAKDFVNQLAPLTKNSSSKIYLAVPFTAISPLVKEGENTLITIGAQNMNDASEGAFTGEIAGRMLKEAGAKFALLGHSERRRLFNENNALINRKVKQALEVDLQPVLCVGETKKEREEGQTQEVICRQITECLADIKPESLQSLILAYEPVWAIGTGENATPEMAQEAHRFCREVLASLLTPELANQIVIQYGGSVTPSNSHDLLSQPDIDGLLVGGASLSLESFSKIVNDRITKL